MDVPEMPRSRSSTISDKSILQRPVIKEAAVKERDDHDQETEGESAPLLCSSSGPYVVNVSSSGVSSLDNSSGSSDPGVNLV